MNAEQAPLDLVSTAVGSTGRAFWLTFLVAGVWLLTWANVVDDVEVSVFGLFATPLNLWVGLVGYAPIILAFAELRASRVLSVSRVLQHQATSGGVDIWVRQRHLGSSVAPQRLRICDGQLWLDDTWWDASLVTVQHGLISRWRRGFPMTVAGYPVRFSVFPADDPASFALWSAVAADRALADAVATALRAPLPAPPGRHEDG
jgi:hypothetical protein